MTPQQRWRFLAVEFVVIVGGVLSALFVDTWIDERQDAERAEIYRERLIADLESDVRNMDAVASYYERIRSYGLLTLSGLEGRLELSDFALLFAAFIAAEEWTFNMENATFEDMKSTGGLALLDDVQLRLAISDYHRQAEVRSVVWSLPRRYREVARGIVPNDLQTAIHENCGDMPGDLVQQAITEIVGQPGDNFSASAVAIETLAEGSTDLCGLDADAFAVERAANQLRSNTELEGLLRFRVSETRVSINLLRGQQEMARSLLDRLGAD